MPLLLATGLPDLNLPQTNLCRAVLLLAWAHAIVREPHSDLAIVAEHRHFKRVECGEESNGLASSGWSCLFGPIPHMCKFNSTEVRALTIYRWPACLILLSIAALGIYASPRAPHPPINEYDLRINRERTGDNFSLKNIVFGNLVPTTTGDGFRALIKAALPCSGYLKRLRIFSYASATNSGVSLFRMFYN